MPYKYDPDKYGADETLLNISGELSETKSDNASIATQEVIKDVAEATKKSKEEEEEEKSVFQLRSGNTTPFKQMGSSPVKQLGLLKHAIKYGIKGAKYLKKTFSKSKTVTKPKPKPPTKVAKKPVHWHDKLRAKNMDRYQMLRNLR